jgi:hypothetical protein
MVRFIEITWGTFCLVNNIKQTFKIIKIEQNKESMKTLLSGKFVSFKIQCFESSFKRVDILI